VGNIGALADPEQCTGGQELAKADNEAGKALGNRPDDHCACQHPPRAPAIHQPAGDEQRKGIRPQKSG
jgi:hypothetical protein